MSHQPNNIFAGTQVVVEVRGTNKASYSLQSEAEERKRLVTGQVTKSVNGHQNGHQTDKKRYNRIKPLLLESSIKSGIFEAQSLEKRPIPPPATTPIPGRLRAK